MIAAIAGVGQTRFRRAGAISEYALAVEAIRAALRDAGLRIDDVDGVVRFDREAAWEFDLPGVMRVRSLDWYAAVPFGAGGAPALVRLAAMAVTQGLARVVVGWHARHGVARDVAPAATSGAEFAVPFGVEGTAHAAALLARRHGIDERTLATVGAMLRRNAARNPRALVRTPLAVADRRRSPLVAEPLRRVDVAPPAVGAGAFVVTDLERASTGRRPPVRVLSSLQLVLPSAARQLADAVRIDHAAVLAPHVRRLYRDAGIEPADVDVACLCSETSALVPLALEAWGFCRRRTGAAFVAGGGLRRPRVDPHGGQLAEASLDGINDVVEAVRQLRGDAANQVRSARLALVAGSLLEPTSAVLLGR